MKKENRLNSINKNGYLNSKHHTKNKLNSSERKSFTKLFKAFTRISNSTESDQTEHRKMIKFIKDPCGIVCILITYLAIFYADYVVTRWIILQTMQNR